MDVGKGSEGALRQVRADEQALDSPYRTNYRCRCHTPNLSRGYVHPQQLVQGPVGSQLLTS